MFEDISLKNFSGDLPLFPLSNVVLFPNIILPLHIFEKRYQKLLKDAMAGEKYIGMAVLKPGWEENYAGNPDIYSHACIGKIIKHEPLSNGRSNILLLGLKRVVIQDIIFPRPYRKAKVKLINDKPKEFNPDKLNWLQDQMLRLYGEVVVEYAGTKRQYPTVSTLEMNFNQLSDVLAASCGLEVKEQMELLQENDPVKRAEMLIDKMQRLLKRGGPKILLPNNPMNFPNINLN